MFSKKIFLIGTLLLTNVNAQITNVPVIINGTFYMSELGVAPSFKLTIEAPNTWAYLYVKIYENGSLYSTTQVLASQLDKYTFYTSPITTRNTKKRIKIAVNYYNNDVEDSVVEFDYKSPSYVTRRVSANTRIQSYNPTSINFFAYGSSSMSSPRYEYFTYNAPKTVTMDGRFIILNDMNYVVESTYTNIPRTVKFGIEHKFTNSGFKYEVYQSVLDIYTTKNSNTYTLRNDYDYYIEKNTGEIKKYSTSTTEEEALPLFLPLSVGHNKEIPVEFKIEEANQNHETYIIYSSISLGDSKFDESFHNIFTNNFYYQKMDEYLEGVTYNA